MRNSTSRVRAVVVGAAGAVVLTVGTWVAVAAAPAASHRDTTTVKACVRTDKNVIVAALASGRCPAGSALTAINKRGPVGPPGPDGPPGPVPAVIDGGTP